MRAINPMANIMVVDDDFDTTCVLGEVLRAVGHQVRTANSGEEALKALKETAFPDLIVLDDEMPPGMSGPAMVKFMHAQHDGEEHIPVILMSGSHRLSELAKEIGTPYALAKPSDIHALILMLNRVLTARSSSLLH